MFQQTADRPVYPDDWFNTPDLVLTLEVYNHVFTLLPTNGTNAAIGRVDSLRFLSPSALEVLGIPVSADQHLAECVQDRKELPPLPWIDCSTSGCCPWLELITQPEAALSQASTPERTAYSVFHTLDGFLFPNLVACFIH